MSTSQEKRKSRRKFKRHILLKSSPTPQPQPQHLQDPVQEQKTSVPVQSIKQVKFSLTQPVSDLLFRPSTDWMKPTHLGRAASFTQAAWSNVNLPNVFTDPHNIMFDRMSGTANLVKLTLSTCVFTSDSLWLRLSDTQKTRRYFKQAFFTWPIVTLGLDSSWLVSWTI